MAGATFYHIILCADWIAPGLFRPKVAALDKDGKPKESKYKDRSGKTQIWEDDGKLVTPANIGEQGSLYRVVTTKWTSTKDNLAMLEPIERTAVNAIKAWINSKPCMVWFHSEGCETNGPHLHVITHATKNRLDDFMEVTPTKQYAFKKIKQVMNKAAGSYKLAPINVLQSMLAYLSHGLRIFFGANSKDMLVLYHKLWSQLNANKQIEEFFGEPEDREGDFVPDIPEESAMPMEDTSDIDSICSFVSKKRKIELEPEASTSAKKFAGDIDFDDIDSAEDLLVPTPAMAKSKGKRVKSLSITEMINVMVNFMMKYSTTNKIHYMSQYNLNPETDKIICQPKFDTMWNKAIELFNLSLDLNLESWYAYSSDWYESYTIFADWCIEQAIDVQLLVFRLYVVLNKLDPKVNVICLVGDSNAGKSFWLKSLLPQKPLTYGTVGKSSTFMWQDCINRPVILMEEALITSNSLEQFKIIAGGQETKVDVKNKASAIMARTPILMATNYAIWAHDSNSETTLRNRCFIYDNLIKSDVLDCGNIEIDQSMWRVLFNWCELHHGISLDIANTDCDPPSNTEFVDYLTETRVKSE